MHISYQHGTLMCVCGGGGAHRWISGVNADQDSRATNTETLCRYGSGARKNHQARERRTPLTRPADVLVKRIAQCNEIVSNVEPSGSLSRARHLHMQYVILVEICMTDVSFIAETDRRMSHGIFHACSLLPFKRCKVLSYLYRIH